MVQPDSVFQHYKEAKDFKSIVYFKGHISHEILGELGSMIKSSYGSESNIKKMFAVFIEMAQNILHYSAERYLGNGGGVGIVMLNEEPTKFSLNSGNLIKNSKVEKIKSNIEKINSLNKEELKKLYKERIKEDRPEDSRGAGLGFIDIARKSDGPITFKIDPVDAEHSFLTLSVYFEKDK